MKKVSNIFNIFAIIAIIGALFINFSGIKVEGVGLSLGVAMLLDTGNVTIQRVFLISLFLFFIFNLIKLSNKSGKVRHFLALIGGLFLLFADVLLYFTAERTAEGFSEIDSDYAYYIPMIFITLMILIATFLNAKIFLKTLKG